MHSDTHKTWPKLMPFSNSHLFNCYKHFIITALFVALADCIAKLSPNPSSMGAEVVIFSFNTTTHPTTHPPGIVFFSNNEAKLWKGKMLEYISRPQIVYSLYLNPKIWLVSSKKGSKLPKNGLCFGTAFTQKSWSFVIKNLATGYLFLMINWNVEHKSRF